VVCGLTITLNEAKNITDLEILSNFTYKTLEWELANEELRGLLVATDFTQGDGTGAEAVRLLDTSCRDLPGVNQVGRM
jgi:hypothetical protein